MLNLIPGVNLPSAQPIATGSSSGRGGGGGRPRAAYRAGGILPGTSRYSEGDDQLVWMRRGEGVTVTEALDEHERARLLALNKAVLGGMSPARFRQQFDAHAGGGIVSYQGKSFTARFVAAMETARALFGRPFHISQGGFRPRTSYSGTSHQGDAVDITSPVDLRLIMALRQAGIAAWDRTGKGDWAPHIHGVPLPGYGSAAGSAVWQAQDYLRGGDGLGGRDNGPRVSAVGGDLQGLFDIPSMLDKVLESIRNGLEGPWGTLMRSGIMDTVLGVKDWIFGKLDGIGQGIADLVFGETKGALGKHSGPGLSGRYATGTGYAQPGWAAVGELGMPEVITGPQLRYMRGGESVTSSAALRSMLGASNGGPNQTHIEHLTVMVEADDLEAVVEFVNSADMVRLQGGEG